MERNLTAIATGLAAAPFVFLIVAKAYWVILSPRGGSDSTIAHSMLSLLVSAAAALIAAGAVWSWVRFAMPPDWMRPVQAMTATTIAGLAIWAGIAIRSKATRPVPQYPGHSAILDVEVRLPKDLLGGRRIDEVVHARFDNGHATANARPEWVREEGGYVILPTEIHVLERHDWSVTLVSTLFSESASSGSEWREERLYLYQLDLPAAPAGAVPWSGWIRPRARKDPFDFDDRLEIRYRWWLEPYGGSTARNYQP